MSIALTNMRVDLKHAIKLEQEGELTAAASAYLNAQHNAANAGKRELAVFCLARRILCLKETGAKGWKKLNERFIKNGYEVAA